jgi:hypothetical protein
MIFSQHFFFIPQRIAYHISHTSRIAALYMKRNVIYLHTLPDKK